MEPIEELPPGTDEGVGAIDIETQFEQFAEQVIGISVFADLVLEFIQENEE